MNHSFTALALQETASDSSTWIIIGVVLVFLFLVVVIVVVGLTIFFVMRRRSKTQKVSETSAMGSSIGSGSSAYSGMPQSSPDIVSTSEPLPESLEISAAAMDSPLPDQGLDVDPYSSPEPPLPAGSSVFDPTQTVAIIREEEKVTVDYGRIKFTSGVLTGEEFAIDPEGAYLGRESSLSQIVVSDPRISKRHLWIGVRDGVVKIEDQDSRNGTFVNDPKSERVKEATLHSGDTVILGESDVARFEYHS
jgi:hypothetical protein